MPWFRWLKKADTTEDAAVDAAPQQIIAPADAAPEEDTESTEAAGDAADAEKRKRRRGSRGGRGRKKAPGATAEATDEQPAAPVKEKETRKAAGKAAKDGAERKDAQQRRRSGTGQRRKQPPRRAPLPAAKRELVISVDVGEQRVAILEDDKVAEVYLERPERRSIAGNIYLGVVDNVLPGMEAAFVEIGLEKNGFLYVDEIVVPELEGKRHGKKIQDLISRGETILVQAVKDPMKTKGARLTTEISLPGRFLVFVPNGEGLGVSRRLEEAERQRLKEILKPIAPADGGVIVRTAAEGASADDIERDLVFLERLWKTIQARANKATAPELVYQEAELPLRIVRDLFAGDFVAAHVDNERVHKRILSYLKKTSPHMIERVHRWKEKEPLFERFGVEQEIGSTLERRVDLPSGGYLIFDYAEAFTVIDVNTGRFVGSRSKSSTQRLEDTIVKNNLEAVKEVVRQLRLRDIGGIIVIDFIDMANAKNRQAVEDALRTELERDRTKTYVVEISPLGLVEMTRQNVTEGPREVMTRRCPTCHGDGIVVSDQTLAMEVERRLRELAAAGAGSRVQAYRVAVHPRTLALLAGSGGSRLAALEELTRRRFFLVEATGHVHGDHLEVLADGRLDDLRPETPVAEGASVEVKLVEVGLHDPTAGVAKLDGLDVVVADAAKLVGKKATVLIGRTLDGQAFATLADGASTVTPITFESEAEKPTRAPARRKQAEPAPEAEPAPVEAEPASTAGAPELPVVTPEGEAVSGDETVDEDVGEGEAEGEGEAQGEERPKKRTRRGSRGGKRRKKKPAEGATEPTADGEGTAAAAPPVAAVEEAGAATVAEAVTGDTSEPSEAPKPRKKRTPKIHVPSPDGGSAGEPDGDGGPAAPGDAEVSAGETTDDEASSGNGADGSPRPRKRTRRGSRGGRGRKKSAQASTATEAGDDAEPEAVAAEGAPVAETGDADGVEDASGGSAPATGRRSTARRRSSVAAAAAPAEPSIAVGDGEGEPSAAPPSTEPSTEPSAEPSNDGGYVPMSEWLDDFEQPSGRR